LLLGAMTPYLFNGCLIRSIYRSGPAIIYDINLQTEEIPSMVDGVIDPDSVRTSNLFVFQCLLSFKRFIPVVTYIIKLVNWTYYINWYCRWTDINGWIYLWSCVIWGSIGLEFRNVWVCMVNSTKINGI
jgi:hypothetical protein